MTFGIVIIIKEYICYVWSCVLVDTFLGSNLHKGAYPWYLNLFRKLIRYCL